MNENKRDHLKEQKITILANRLLANERKKQRAKGYTETHDADLYSPVEFYNVAAAIKNRTRGLFPWDGMYFTKWVVDDYESKPYRHLVIAGAIANAGLGIALMGNSPAQAWAIHYDAFEKLYVEIKGALVDALWQLSDSAFYDLRNNTGLAPIACAEEDAEEDEEPRQKACAPELAAPYNQLKEPEEELKRDTYKDSAAKITVGQLKRSEDAHRAALNTIAQLESDYEKLLSKSKEEIERLKECINTHLKAESQLIATKADLRISIKKLENTEKALRHKIDRIEKDNKHCYAVIGHLRENIYLLEKGPALAEPEEYARITDTPCPPGCTEAPMMSELNVDLENNDRTSFKAFRFKLIQDALIDGIQVLTGPGYGDNATCDTVRLMEPKIVKDIVLAANDMALKVFKTLQELDS